MFDDGSFKVLIAGGGVAGLEALLALCDLLGDRVEVEVVAPDSEFTYRPLAVAEPFGHGAPARLPLTELIENAGGTHRKAALVSIDPERKRLQTDEGEELSYEALLVALGVKTQEAIPGALTYRGLVDNAAVSALMEELQRGKVDSVAFAVPTGVRWSLPIYELALLAARHLEERGIVAQLVVVTPEVEPLAMFGHRASRSVRSLLDQSRVDLRTEAAPSSVRGGELVLMSGDGLAADRVVSLPRLEVPPIPGLPQGPHGFIGTDRYMQVETVTRIYAAGDATWFPIKQGGVAAQQADSAATSIAGCADPSIERLAFRPVLRGALLTGHSPRYLRSRVGARDAESASSDAPLWWPPSKIAGRYLAPFLAARSEGVEAGATLEDRVSPEGSAAEGTHADAVELALAGADAEAHWGEYHDALRWLELAESLAITLPPSYVRKREEWVRLADEPAGRGA